MKKVITPKFRVSFPYVFKQNTYNADNPKYTLTMLFPKKSDLSEIEAIILAAIEARWPDVAKRPKNIANPLRDGDVERDGTPGYEGCIFASCSSQEKPQIIDFEKKELFDDTEFYAGCYARASIVAYTYDIKGNRGVALGLQNVQKLADGEKFSGRAKAADEFDAVSSDGMV